MGCEPVAVCGGPVQRRCSLSAHVGREPEDASSDDSGRDSQGVATWAPRVRDRAPRASGSRLRTGG